MRSIVQPIELTMKLTQRSVRKRSLVERLRKNLGIFMEETAKKWKAAGFRLHALDPAILRLQQCGRFVNDFELEALRCAAARIGGFDGF